MRHTLFRHPVTLLVGAAIAIACHSSGTSTSTAPAPGGGAATRAAANATPTAVTPASIAIGDSIFHARGCRNCHGPDAKGRQNGPDLTSGKFLQMNGSYNDMVRVITDGVPTTAIKDTSHKRAMPARGGTPPLTDDQIKAVAAFVWSLNHK